MNYVILVLSMVTVSFGMQTDNTEAYLGCRYEYLLKYKELPPEDYSLYTHYLKLFTFINVVVQKFSEAPTHLIMMKGGQSRQGLYLTSGTPPGMITPWGKLFTLIIDSKQKFLENKKILFWQEVKKFIVIGDPIKERPLNEESGDIYPILSYNETTLPEPILRPYAEISENLPKFINTKSETELYELQNKLFAHLERVHKSRNLNLENLCIKTIKKHVLDISPLPLELQEKIKK